MVSVGRVRKAHDASIRVDVMTTTTGEQALRLTNVYQDTEGATLYLMADRVPALVELLNEALKQEVAA